MLPLIDISDHIRNLNYFRRGLAQRCPEPRMKTLITMAGQHQGLYGIPDCDPITKPLCDQLRKSVNDVAYLGFVL